MGCLANDIMMTVSRFHCHFAICRDVFCPVSRGWRAARCRRGTMPCPYDTVILTIAHRAFVNQVSYFTPKDHIYSWERCRTVVTAPRAQVLRCRVIPAGKVSLIFYPPHDVAKIQSHTLIILCYVLIRWQDLYCHDDRLKCVFRLL